MNLTEKEWYIEAPWGRICILAWGSCLDPPVLLCHGASDSAASFRPLIKCLPKNFYYIGMEVPGNGKSDRLPGTMMISIYDLVYAMDVVVKHFRWDKFAFIGHSMGSLVGQLYNVSCPGKVSKLVVLDLINYAAFSPDQFSQWYHIFFSKYYVNYDKYALAKEAAIKHKRTQAVENLMKRRGLTEEAAVATLDRWSEPAGPGLIRYTLDPRFKLVNYPPFSTEHIRKNFTSHKTPTLTIASNESLKKGIYRNTAFLLDEKIYPNGNVRSFKVDGNHDVHVNNPEIIAGYVGPFLLGGVEALDSKAKL